MLSILSFKEAIENVYFSKTSHGQQITRIVQMHFPFNISILEAFEINQVF
jgi:hypothetical protein